MGKILVQDKAIVIPGEVLAEGMDYLPAGDVIREGEHLIALKIGLINISGRLIKVIPLCGRYVPKAGDMVIGQVVNMGFSGWRVEIGWPYEANLSPMDAGLDFVNARKVDISKYYSLGDWITTQISKVGFAKLVDISMKGLGLRKLGPGRIIEINPTKVPRIIGKQGSMISMIKEATECKITVGQNGIVWLSGPDPKKELIAVRAIEKIDSEAHISGLTDRIKEFLDKETKRIEKPEKTKTEKKEIKIKK